MSVDSQDPVPFVDLALQFSAMDAEIMDAVRSVAEKSSFIRGPALGEFEIKFALDDKPADIDMYRSEGLVCPNPMDYLAIKRII